MKKQLLLLLFSLFAVMGYARTVTGVVTSASDKEPIIGASVQVQAPRVALLPTLTENTRLRLRTMTSLWLPTLV